MNGIYYFVSKSTLHNLTHSSILQFLSSTQTFYIIYSERDSKAKSWWKWATENGVMALILQSQGMEIPVLVLKLSFLFSLLLRETKPVRSGSCNLAKELNNLAKKLNNLAKNST